MTTAAIRAELLELLEPIVRAAGIDLEDLTVTRAGGRRVLRLVVDADGGVSLDDLARASTEVSRALDGSEAMGAGAYTLEVTSPGVDRPLIGPRHWRRAAGRLVHVPLRGDGELCGRVVTVDGDGVVFEVDGRSVRHGFAALGRGRVQVEFRRAQGDADGIADEDPEGQP